MHKSKKLTLALTTTLLFSTTYTLTKETAPTDDIIEATITMSISAEKHHKHDDWKGFLQQQIKPLCIAMGVGAITGGICALAERKKIIGWPFSWMLFWGTRNAIMQILNKDMKRYDISHDEQLTIITARLVDWITYLIL